MSYFKKTTPTHTQRRPRLSIPDISHNSEMLVEVSPKKIRMEIEQLPYADIGVSLTIARQKLRILNRFFMTSAKRTSATEIFNLAFRQCSGFLSSKNQVAYNGVAVSAHELLELSRLTEELAFAYKLIFIDHFNNERFDKNMRMSVYTAMYYMGQHILQSYHPESTHGASCWGEIHYLFQLAESMNWLDEPIDSPAPEPRPKNIRDLYKQIVLEQALEGSKLSAIQQQLVHDFAGRWQHKAQLKSAYTLFAQRQESDTPQPTSQDAAPVHVITIDLDSNSAPYPQREPNIQPSSSIRYVLIDSYIAHIESLQSKVASGELVRVIGLPDIAYNREQWTNFLGTAKPIWSERQLRTEHRHAPVSTATTTNVIWGIDDIFTLLNPVARQNAQDSNSKLPITHTSQASPTNESYEGIGFNFLVNPLPGMGAGQLVAWREQIGGKTILALGSVQWQADQQDGSLQCGIKKHAARAYAAQLSFNENAENTSHCLVFKMPNNQLQIVTAPGQVVEGERGTLKVLVTGHTHDIEISDQQQQNRFSDRFNILITSVA